MQISDNRVFFFAETEKLNGIRAQLGLSSREHSDNLLEASEGLRELVLQGQYQRPLPLINSLPRHLSDNDQKKYPHSWGQKTLAL